jgi:hypothetical protein
MKGKRFFALLLAFVVALAVFVVPASASTPSLARLDGSALSNISLAAGSSLTFHAIGAAGSSVSVSGAPVGWTVRTGTGGNMPTSIPAGTNRVFIEVTAEHNAAASGNINFSIGGTNVPVSLTRTSTGTWNPGLLVVAANDGVVARGSSINLTFRISRLGAGDGPVTVNVTPVGALPAGMSIGAVTINPGMEVATVALNTTSATLAQTHNLQFNIAASGVVMASTATVEVTVGGTQIILGDVNNDSLVNASDASWILQHVAGNTPAGFNHAAGDVNKDDLVNASDASWILQLVAGIRTSFD